MEKGFCEVRPPAVKVQTNNKGYLVFFNALLLIAYGMGYYLQKEPKVITTRPSHILQFKPVCRGSDPNDIRIAQAELCRHGIDVKIDGKCGAETALGMCEFLVLLENGYEQFKYYERNPNGKEKRNGSRGREE